jgi:hypothetical protein
VRGDDDLVIQGHRVTTAFNSYIDFEEGRFHYDGRDILNWGAAGPALIITGPLIVSEDEGLTLAGYAISSQFGPTVLNFEEARLEYAGGDVLYWGEPGQLSVASRTLKDLGAPMAANDAVRKVDLDALIARVVALENA